MTKYYRAVKRNQHQLYVCVDYSVCPRIWYLLCPGYLETHPDHQHLSAPCSLAPRRWGRSGSQMWLWSRPTRGYSRSSKGLKEAHLGSFFLVSSSSQSPVFATAAPPRLQLPSPLCSPAPPRSHWASGPPLLFSTLNPRESSATSCPQVHLYFLNQAHISVSDLFFKLLQETNTERKEPST